MVIESKLVRLNKTNLFLVILKIDHRIFCRQCFKTFFLHHRCSRKMSCSVCQWRVLSPQFNIFWMRPRSNCYYYSGLTQKYYSVIKRLDRDKRTSLAVLSIGDEWKKFYSIGAWVPNEARILIIAVIQFIWPGIKVIKHFFSHWIS